METTINMPQSDLFSSEDTIVQDIMADPNIKPNLLQAAINTLSSRINTMQSAQATPTLGKIDSSDFDHQRSELESQAQSTFDISGFDHQRWGLAGQATPPSSSSPYDHQGSAIEGSDSNICNQIIALTTNPNIPFKFRIKEIKGRIRRET